MFKFAQPKVLALALCTVGFTGAAQADTCNSICTATEVAAQAACVLEIFGEPECSIAVAAAYAACQAACVAASNGTTLAMTAAPDTHADLMKSSITSSDLCNGKLTPSDPEKAKAFCAVFK